MIKEIINIADEKMKKTIAVLKYTNLATMKAGRANPNNA